MKTTTKKWLLILGGLVLCAVLATILWTQFQKEKPADEPVPIDQSEAEYVTDVKTEPLPPPMVKEDAVTPTIEPAKPNIPVAADDGAVSSGTEQSLQADPVKPNYTDAQLTDQTQTPDGEKITEPPQPVEHDEVEPTKDVPKPSNPSGGLPGFDNVPYGGENHVEYVDGDGDINKQVGIMG